MFDFQSAAIEKNDDGTFSIRIHYKPKKAKEEETSTAFGEAKRMTAQSLEEAFEKIRGSDSDDGHKGLDKFMSGEDEQEESDEPEDK